MDTHYFQNNLSIAQRLKQHGLVGWPPTAESLAELAIETSDRLDSVCNALGITTAKDHRGKWQVLHEGDDSTWSNR